MNNDILIDSLSSFGVTAQASGRNDIVVGDKKISGSAYKLKLGKSDGTGRRSLHHGTMLLSLELGALQKYLNPNKKKLASKGVDSVVSRVMNLKEIVPDITHEKFCKAVEKQFIKKWSSSSPVTVNVHNLASKELLAIPKLAEIFEGYKQWEWRFGETPDFQHSLEHKFTWALINLECNVEKGVIVAGKVYSDCLYPPFIDQLNHELASGKVTYDTNGIKLMCSRLAHHFSDPADAMQQQVRDTYLPELQQWLIASI